MRERFKLPDPHSFDAKAFWAYIRRFATRIPFLKEALALYYCLMDQATPTQVKLIVAAALAYFVLPLDAIPDILAVVGFSDDAAVILLAWQTVRTHVTDDHLTRAQEALEDLKHG
jgi:uncharacterized membrane protein YkvA (DUF1232 family)